MLEHRRNGWYVLGGSMIAGGIAWLAAWGVAFASSSPAHSLRFWVPPSYIAVVVTMAGFLVVATVMYDWLARLPWPYPRKTELPLKVVAGDPHYHDWNHEASVAALPIVVTNRTGAPVTLPGGSSAKFNGGDTQEWRTSIPEDQKSLFTLEVESQIHTSHHAPNINEKATIPAHASLQFWYVSAIIYAAYGVRPAATVYFNDDQGNEYSAVFKRFEPRQA